MSSDSEVVILQPSAGAQDHLQESIHSKGFSTRVITNFEHLLPTLRKIQHPIILVDYGKSESIGVDCTKFLLSNSQLSDFPLILMGIESENYTQVIGKYFKHLVTLGYPSKSSDIISAITHLSKSAPKQVEPPSALSKDRVNTNGIQSVKKQETKIEESNLTIPEVLISELTKLSLSANSLGASGYSSKINESYLKKLGLFPKKKEIAQIAEDISMDAGKWGKMHLCRVTFIASKILKALRFDTDHIELVQSASFLFAWSFCGTNTELLKRNYLRLKSTLRKDVCSRIKDSAMKVSSEIRNSDISELIAAIARIIGLEPHQCSETTFILASAVAGADILDRVCFHSNCWDPRGAFKLMQKVKSGELTEIHPAILCCMIKFLSEKLAAVDSSKLLLSKKIAGDPELRRKAEELKNQTVEDDEEKISLNSLTPGMKLSRPIFAFDGREILSGDLILDQDLIWRIWQLSAIRPLNSTVVVTSKN